MRSFWGWDYSGASQIVETYVSYCGASSIRSARR
jgi:hypothetical protein